MTKTDKTKTAASLATKSGLTLPPVRIKKLLKSKGSRVSPAAPIYLTAAIEWVLHDVIIKAVEEAQLNGKTSRIGPAAVMTAARHAPCKRAFAGLTLATSHVLAPPGESILTREAVAKRRAKRAQAADERQKKRSGAASQA